MTQNECKQKFFELCNEMNRRISEIDKQTPWSDVEPQWWLDMMEIQRLTLRAVAPPIGQSGESTPEVNPAATPRR